MSRDSSHPVSFHVMLSVSVAAPSHQHPSVFHLVSVLQQDAALAETLIEQDAPGQAAATCRAAPSATTAAAVLRRGALNLQVMEIEGNVCR